MAEARKCDICGKYFDVSPFNPCRLNSEERFNIIRLHRARLGDEEDCWISFDACDKCYQNMLDHILTEQSEI